MVKLIQYRWDLGCDIYRIPHTSNWISFCSTSNENIAQDDGGADLFPYAHPFESAVRNIEWNDSRSQTDAGDPWNSFACCTGSRDDQCNNTNGDICGEGVNAFYLNLAAVSNDWYRYIFLQGWKNRTGQLLAELAQKHQLWTPPLINHVLWGDQTPLDTEFNDALWDMPCDEYHPYKAAIEGQSSKWVVDNRFEKYWHAKNRKISSGVNSGLQYNALDYLLLHNLYTIKGGGDGNYINYQNRFISKCSDMKLPTCSPEQYKTITNKSLVAIQNITANIDLTVANCSGGLTEPFFLAGNNIKLTTGFHAKGDDISFKVRKITCNDYPFNPCSGQRMAQNELVNNKVPASINENISVPSYKPILEKKNKSIDTTGLIQGINNLKFYPNPVSDKLTIEINSRNTNIDLVYLIIDSNGKTIQSGHLKEIPEGQINKLELNISNLANGLYIIKV
ncbi:MAG: T9SS type A sorting domain-containing protein, partial [Cytophagales bacterium]|nr:T9SS type A sorting domain-containing protein [Cytophagales bacterium]